MTFLKEETHLKSQNWKKFILLQNSINKILSHRKDKDQVQDRGQVQDKDQVLKSNVGLL